MQIDELTAILYGYDGFEDYFDREKYMYYIESMKNFDIDPYKFIFINNEYEIHVKNNVYKSAYHFLKDNMNHFDNKCFTDFMMNKTAIENNDLERLAQYSDFNKGYIYIYIPSSGKYEYYSTNNHYNIVKKLIENKVPFRYHNHDYECTTIYYVNNIDGVYKLHDPNDYVTNDDITNANIFSLIELV